MNLLIRRKSSLLWILVHLFLITRVSLNASTQEDIQNKVDEYIGAYVKMNQFGGSILVAQNDQVLINKGYGMANVEFEILNDPQTKFRIGSLTKLFTAVAIMMLEEKGVLSVDDHLTKYIPDYPDGDQITIVHLLTHTSGIPDHAELPDFNRERRVYRYDLLQTIETFKNLPLEFTPGEKSKYSNSGYILLGYIIEQVTQTSFENFVDQNIFKPLYMVHSGYEWTDQVIKQHANGYASSGNEIIKAAYRDISNAHASGALYSTAEDLYLWDRALYTEELITFQSLKKMFTPFKEQFEFGYGWGIVDLFNRKMVGHNGETEGFYSNITRFINDDVCIIVLSNIDGAPAGQMGVDLAAILFGEPYTIPEVREIAEVDPDILNNYVGKYELNPNFHCVITKENTQLYCQPTGQDQLEIYPESETVFFLKEVEIQITFVRGENGKVEKLILHQGGNDIPLTKIE